MITSQLREKMWVWERLPASPAPLLGERVTVSPSVVISV